MSAPPGRDGRHNGVERIGPAVGPLSLWLVLHRLRPARAPAGWSEIGGIPATLILYESPKRVHRLLGELCDHWGETRPAALCRELTKRFEEVRRGTLGSLRDGMGDAPPKGEIVLVVGRPLAVVPEAADVDAALVAAMARLRVKDAATEVAEALGLPRRDVHQRALALKEGNEA